MLSGRFVVAAINYNPSHQHTSITTPGSIAISEKALHEYPLAPSQFQL
jgi:hypothetical protein